MTSKKMKQRVIPKAQKTQWPTNPMPWKLARSRRAFLNFAEQRSKAEGRKPRAVRGSWLYPRPRASLGAHGSLHRGFVSLVRNAGHLIRIFRVADTHRDGESV